MMCSSRQDSDGSEFNNLDVYKTIQIIMHMLCMCVYV